MFYVKFIISLLQAAEYGVHKEIRNIAAEKNTLPPPHPLNSSPNTHITTTY